MTRLISVVIIRFRLVVIRFRSVVMIRFRLAVIRFRSVVMIRFSLVVMIRFRILDKSMLSFMSYIVINSYTSVLCCPSCIHDTSFQSHQEIGEEMIFLDIGHTRMPQIG